MNDQKKNYDKYFYKVKFITIGEVGVGKTNILYRYVKGEFKNQYEATIGVDFLSQNVKIRNLKFQLSLVDTAGEERFKSIVRGFYSNSTCCLIVYDISDRTSFESLNNWIEDCRTNTDPNIITILVGNKSDKKNERKVTEEEGKILADKYDIKFFESSALTGFNIKEIFIYACEKIYDNILNNVYNFDDENDSCGVKRFLFNETFKSDKNFIVLNNEGKHNKKKKKRCC